VFEVHADVPLTRGPAPILTPINMGGIGMAKCDAKSSEFIYS